MKKKLYVVLGLIPVLFIIACVTILVGAAAIDIIAAKTPATNAAAPAASDAQK